MARDRSEGSRSSRPKRVAHRSPVWLILVVLVATMLSFAGSVTYSQRIAARIDEDAMSIATNASPAIEHLSAARGQVLRIQVEAASAIQRAGRQLDRGPFDRAFSRLHDELTAYLDIPFYPNEHEHYLEVERAVVALDDGVSALLQRLAENDTDGAVAVLTARLTPAASRLDQTIEVLINFNAEQQHRLGFQIPARRIHAARILYFLEGVTALLALALMGLVVRAIRQNDRLLEQQKRASEERANALAEFSGRLEKIVDTSVNISAAITHSSDLRTVLQAVVEGARSVVDADYAAVGCGTDPERPFDPWIVSGVSTAAARAMGRPPRPRGVLGEVVASGRTIRLDDVTARSSFSGLPAEHWRMGPFLGIPILHEGRNVGNLYLARKEGRPVFGEEDEHLTELFAAHVGVALNNARLYNQAQAATRAREDVVATVSHDLKTPLNAIRLATELLRRRREEQEVGEVAARIDRSVDRMTRLISDLLDAAKIEAGLLRAALQPEDVAGMVEEAVEMFREEARRKLLRLDCRAPSEPIVVLCERNLIGRVFSNLIGNAVKFTPSGGFVSVEVERLAGQVRFSVRDSGPGIASEDAPRLFDRYWQSRGGDRRGSGLGLYIAKGIVEAHDGRIWAESAIGEGTTMHFTLPDYQERKAEEALTFGNPASVH